MQRANLDGSNVEDILTSADGMNFPRGVFVGPDPAAPPLPALQPQIVVALLCLMLAVGASSLRLREQTRCPGRR